MTPGRLPAMMEGRASPLRRAGAPGECAAMVWLAASWKLADGDVRGAIDLHHNGKYHWRAWRVGPWGKSARGTAPTLDRAQADAEAAARKLAQELV